MDKYIYRLHIGETEYRDISYLYIVGEHDSDLNIITCDGNDYAKC